MASFSAYNSDAVVRRIPIVLPRNGNVNLGQNEREDGVCVYRFNLYVLHTVSKLFVDEGDVSLLREYVSSGLDAL